MTVKDKTKAQLKKELAALREKLAQYEEAEKRRQGALSFMWQAIEESKAYESPAEFGTWLWDCLSRTAVFQGSPTRAKSPLHEHFENHFRGSWEEIIDSRNLPDVLKAIESYIQDGSIRPLLSFRFKEEPQSEKLMMAIPIHLLTDQNSGQNWVAGFYWDATIFKEMVDIVKKPTDHELLEAAGVGFYMGIRPLIRSSDLLYELKYENEVLTYQLHFYSLIMGGQNVPLFVKDLDEKYVSANDALADYFGIPVSEIIGKKDDQLFADEYPLPVEHDIAPGFKSNLTMKIVKLKGSSRELYLIMHLVGRLSSDQRFFVGTVVHRFDQSPSDDTSEYKSPAMRKTMNDAARAARTDSTILLRGESGSGKDFLAKHIHDHSGRSAGAFYSINCAAIAPELAESELFGHEPGAFTGARWRRRGLLELAEGGTLFLNEIGELSLRLQAKLLTFLDTRKFTRVGGEREITVNARIITATNKDLEDEVKSGKFREDLLFRLKVIQIRIPPLRDRWEDTPLLVSQILDQLQAQLDLPERPRLTARDRNAIMQYHWPGNIRELKNVLERGIALSDGPGLQIRRHLGQSGTPSQSDEMWREPSGSELTWSVRFPLNKKLEDLAKDMKRALVEEALHRTKGNKSEAARLLGIDRHTLAEIAKKS